MAKGTEAESTSHAATDGRNAEVGRPTPAEVLNHGFMRVLTRPAQWLILVVLLISWSAAGIFMFDFVTDDQLTNLQRIGSDPVTAVNEAVEDFTDKLNHMNEILTNPQEYVPTLISDPTATLDQWTDASVTLLSEVLGDGREGVAAVLKLSTDVLDDVNGWIRSPVQFLFHVFEDLLDLVVLGPLEIAGDVAVYILSTVKTIVSSALGVFTGIKVWIPKLNTSPMELASDVLEGAGDLKTSVVTRVFSLFYGKEGGVPDLNFDPMKVVTDTVEEISDRRDMFLAYLSSVLMDDKDEAPHVIRRKGEFLPPMEKVPFDFETFGWGWRAYGYKPVSSCFAIYGQQRKHGGADD